MARSGAAGEAAPLRHQYWAERNNSLALRISGVNIGSSSFVTGLIMPAENNDRYRNGVENPDSTEHREDLWRSITEGVSAATGEEFFRSLVTHLSRALKADYVFVGELTEHKPERIRSIATFVAGKLGDDFEYDLAETPCENVVGRNLCVYPSGVQQQFPRDYLLAEMGVEGYVGTPLFDSAGRALGLLVALYRGPVSTPELAKSLLQIFAVRAAAELERQQAEKKLRESEELFRQLAENIRDVFWLRDVAESRVIYVSPEVQSFMGRSPLELDLHERLNGFMQCIHPDDRPQVEAMLRKVEPFDAEYRMVHPDGSVRWLHDRGFPIRDDRGRVYRMAGVAEDITERRQATEALRESEERYRTLLSLSSEAISRVEFDEPITLDRLEKEVIDLIFDTGYLAECNDVHAQIHGFGSGREMVGTRLREFIPEAPDVEALYRRFSRSGFRLTEGEVQNVDHEGNVKYFHLSLIGVVKNNLLHRIWRIARDVTERKLAELDLAETNARLRAVISTAQEYEGIVGDSAEIQDVLGQIETVAPTDSTVLILGETGTGKELVARAIHGRSRREERPLVKVNCAALAPGLIESELFGHEKGAFTGAVSAKTGRFELANGGTILLDEIGDLPLELQTKLLRVLQEEELERVGGSRTRKVDVRVIAATNRDLQAAVQEGRFRTDLYYRLNVFPLTLPPLRDRKNDVPLLAQHFLDSLSKKLGKPLTGFSKHSIQRLLKHNWPGNVRELHHVIERAAILATGPVVEMCRFSRNGRANAPR